MPLFKRSVVTAVCLAASIFAFSKTSLAEVGRASWYSLTSKTASGERCDPGALTAAHRSLPFGTKVKVENLKNGRSVVVRINDRGPFVGGRVIDLTKAAARQLGFISSGIARVRLTVLQRS
jgi:rare lipoprotein A